MDWVIVAATSNALGQAAAIASSECQDFSQFSFLQVGMSAIPCPTYAFSLPNAIRQGNVAYSAVGNVIWSSTILSGHGSSRALLQVGVENAVNYEALR